MSRFLPYNLNGWQLLVFLAFVFLPTLPELSGVIFLLYTLRHFRSLEFRAVPNVHWFFVIGLLGFAAQTVQVVFQNPRVDDGFWGRGLLQPLDAAYLTAWSRSNSGKQWAQFQENGFWRIRQNLNATVEEIYVSRQFQIQTGISYTQRFQVRSDVPLGFMVSVFTARGHRLVEPILEGVSDDRSSFRVEFTAQPGDGFVRAFDLVVLRGPWSWIELGSLQFFRTHDLPVKKFDAIWFERLVYLKLWYWFGEMLLVACGFALMKQFSRLRFHRTFVVALLIGLVGLLVWVVLSLRNNGIMLPTDKNQLAHGGTMTAALLVMIAPFGLGLSGILIAFVAALLLGARGALLVLTIVFLGSLWRFGYLRSWRWLVGFVLLLSLGVLAWQVRPSAEAFQSGIARFNIWHIAWEAILKRPQGYGPGQFAFEYARVRHSDAFDAVVAHPHNLILGILFEFGWLGFLAFFGFMLILIRQFLLARAWLHLMIIAVAASLNVIDYTWFTAGLAIPLWLALGVPRSSISTHLEKAIPSAEIAT